MPIPNNGTIEDVINLLNQTQGINQKVELAGVIGDPAQPSDDISTQIGILSEIKEDVSDAIINKGGTYSTSDPMSDISQAILSLPTGGKLKSGTSSVNTTAIPFQYYSTTTSTNMRHIDTNELTFEPDLILAIYQNGNNSYFIFYSKDNLQSSPNSIRVSSYNGSQSSEQVTYVFKSNVNSAVVNSTNFVLPTPSGLPGTAIFNWLAIAF